MLTLAHGVHYLGTVGIPPTTAIYLVNDEDDAAIIEPGPNSGAESVVRMVRESGTKPETIRKIVATHIHLDHAGASQALLNAYPKGRLLVYKGASKYLTDTTQLSASASQILGPLFAKWGGMPAVDGGRIDETEEGATIKVGRIELKVVYTPGHAPFHMSLWEERTKTMFTGDAVGMYVRRRNTLWPASPLPSFRYDLEMNSLAKIREFRPKILNIPHFEPVTEADEFLRLNFEVYQKWHEVLGAMKGMSDVEAAARKLVSEIETYRWVMDDPQVWFTLKMHVAGFLQFEGRPK